jgi:uncharacterized membrane protein
MSTEPPVTPPVAEDKTVAILSYLTLIGFIVAIVLHGSKKTKLGSYHLRQTLGLFLTAVACGACGFALAFVPFLGFGILPVIWLGLFVLWVMGLLAAVNGQMKPLPVLGEYYQKWLGTAFD